MASFEDWHADNALDVEELVVDVFEGVSDA